MTASHLSDDAKRLFAITQRGGEKSYFWSSATKKSNWHNSAKIIDAPLPTLENIYFGVHPAHAGAYSANERSKNATICALNCFYAEFDVKDFGTWDDLDTHIKNLPVAPSVQVTSGGGVHCYWFFNKTVKIDDKNRPKWAGLQAQWVAKVGGDGAAKDIARVLRVPDTWNVKYEPKRSVFVRCGDWCEYDVNHLIDAMQTHDDISEIVPPAQQPMTGGIDAGAKALINGAITRMQSAIADTNRNQSLNDACCIIGGLVGANRITRDEALRIVEQLKQIAIGKGLPVGEVEKTAKSGLEGGILKPIENRPMTTSATPTPTTNDEKLQIDVTQTIDLSSFAASDFDNAKAFVMLYPEKYRYTIERGWYRYDEKSGIWRHDNADAMLAKDIAEMLEKRQIDAVKARKNDIVTFCKPNAGRIASTRTLLESLCYFDFLKFDQHKNYVCCKNVVIDVTTSVQYPHAAHFGFTSAMTANLNNDADENLIEEYLLKTVKGGAEMVKWLQRFCGNAITGITANEFAVYVHGPSRAGKGTFFEALKDLMGDDLCHTLSFAALAEKRDPDSNNFDLAPLRGARLVIADESNRKDRLNGGKLKTLTGGNHIHCAFKGKDFFSYRPMFKVLMISNWPPNCDPDDDAAWGRLRVIEFPNSHLENEDLTIKEKFKSVEFQEALLKWCVLGAMELHDSGGRIATVPQIKTSTNEARGALDTIQQWLDQCTMKRDDLYTESAKLYQNYAQWAENMGFEAKSSRNLMQTLRAKGYDTSAQKWAEGRNLRVTTGLGLLFSSI